MRKNKLIASLLVSSLILLVIYIKLPDSKQLDFTTWLWHTELIKSEREEIIQFIKEENITTVYLQYLPELNNQYYQNFISNMTEAGVTVYALDGSPTWANDYHEEEAFFKWFVSYQNSSLPIQQFKGIHLDVEPYLQSEWESNQADVVKKYQEMVKRGMEKSQKLEIVFGLDIPFWFDEIYFNNAFGSGSLAQWIIKTVDEITIMAYRNYANGEGGIIEISQNEIEWADIEKKQVTIAVETVPLPEIYTSFNNKSIKKMEEELNAVRNFYRKNPSFTGVAVHHLGSWRELKHR
jgi:hypothetical protein